jgi:bifunctional ADP-heptose synthase (sugar kinase/adenylyltransferase)
LVVLGDALLDVDLEGGADRLCPDAPVPVVDVRREWRRAGGAGLAARLAGRSVSDVVLVTALGDDEAGTVLAGLLESEVDVVKLPYAARPRARPACGRPVSRWSGSTPATAGWAPGTSDRR